MATEQQPGLSAHAARCRSLDPGWAWAPYEPNPERPWELPLAGHLFRRTVFGATWQDLQQAIQDGPQRTLDRILRPEADLAAFQRTYDEHEASVPASESVAGLQALWLRRMLLTPHPLLERITLFWHGHFAASNFRVRSSASMARHVQMLRSHALGHFDDFLQAILNDPAVFVALSAESNRKTLPNLQFARQILQWCGLELEKCSEQDLDGIARTMTGWFVRRDELKFVEREHDPTPKTIFGETGTFHANDLAPLLLKQPAVGRYVIRRLYRYLISEIDLPPESLLAPLAKSFSADYDLAKLVETMLRSNLFFSLAAYRRRIKSPVELVLGIIRPLGGMVATPQLSQDVASLGQILYEPPTTKGWEGGRYWLSQATMVQRDNLALSLLGGWGPYAGGLDPAAVARQHGHEDLASARQFLLDLFLQGDLRPPARTRLLADSSLDHSAGQDLSEQLRRFTHNLIVQPEFQLG